MKEITLLRGQVTLVDDEDYERLRHFQWTLTSNGYVRRTRGNGLKGTIYIHHDIVGPAPDGTEVDHIDRDRLNNQKSNLRFVTRAQNMQNRKGGSSSFLGVTWHSRDEVWQAAIAKDGQTFYLGQFEEELKAALAYDETAKKLYGDKATLNFPFPIALPKTFPFGSVLNKL